MSKSPYATQPYLRNKGSPFHQHNRTQTIINNTNSIGPVRNTNTLYQTKQNSANKMHYINYRPSGTQHARSKAQNNTQSCTFRYQPSNFGSFYPCSTKNDSKREVQQTYINNNSNEYPTTAKNKRTASQLSQNQFPFSKNIKNIAMKAQQNRITDKLTTLQEKIAKMKATIDLKKNQFKAFIQKDKSENKSKRDNSQIEKNKNNSISKLKIQKKRKKNQTEGGQQIAASKQYIKTSNFKNSPVFKDSSSRAKYENIDKIVTRVSNEKHYHGVNKNPYCSKQNWVYYVSQVIRTYKDKQSLVREHIQSSLGILRYFKSCKIPSYESISDKCVYLKKPPGYEKKKTIIFDLDETLVHCNQTPDLPFHEKISVCLPNGESTFANINIRPYAKQILKNLNPYFEIIIFTASHSCYANAVIDLLDPQNKYVHHRLFREQCVKSLDGMYVKDLRVLNRALTDMVLVDNAAYSYAYQIDNGVPIIPYYEGQLDFELQALQTYLYKIINLQDVRELNKKTFKLNYYSNYIQAENLIKDLYIRSIK